MPGDLGAFVQALVDDAQFAHPESAIVVDFPPALTANFDPERMAQVVSNLLSNARTHGVIGGSISVRVAGHPDKTELSVSNLAQPIADADLGSLFDPFKPRSVGNVRNPGGLGLGLYIVSEVAKGHRGQLDYSHDGTRVTFTVTLPTFAENVV